MTPEELVADVCPRIRDLGWAFYFVPDTLERGRQLGLDGLRFYFLGRGGVLGDVEAAVVTSAFAYFKPSMIEDMWTSARAIVPPPEAARAFVECAAAHGRARLSGIEGIDAFCAAADAVIAAADPVGLALYSGAAAEHFADDPPARAMQLVALLREYRGGVHLVAIRASGLDALTAHCVKRPQDLAMFGWSDDEAVEITDADLTAWNEAEALTDRLVLPAYSALDEAGRDAFVAGLDRIEAALTGR
jgi:hypothetical protein